MCLPLRTCYEANSDIFKCANDFLPCDNSDNIKIAEDCENKRVINYLHRINQENIVKNEIGFLPNLFEKLIAAPIVYIDKDLVCFMFYDI